MQTLLHLDPETAARGPLDHSTWSDALAAPPRHVVLRDVVPALVKVANAVLPGRLAGLPGLGDRPVRAIDGTYLAESVHFRRRTPQQGGEGNHNGHALLSFYNLRPGVPEDVGVDTRSRHETRSLRDYDQDPQALTRGRYGLWLVNRAFIDAPFWDAKQRALQMPMVTLIKSNLCADSTEGLPDKVRVSEAIHLPPHRFRFGTNTLLPQVARASGSAPTAADPLPALWV